MTLIDDRFKVIIYASTNNPEEGTILKQIEICQNFADFYEYDVVGIATEIQTLFLTNTEYDGVIVAMKDKISEHKIEYQFIKQMLLEKQKIIITAVRS